MFCHVSHFLVSYDSWDVSTAQWTLHKSNSLLHSNNKLLFTIQCLSSILIILMSSARFPPRKHMVSCSVLQEWDMQMTLALYPCLMWGSVIMVHIYIGVCGWLSDRLTFGLRGMQCFLHSSSRSPPISIWDGKYKHWSPHKILMDSSPTRRQSG